MEEANLIFEKPISEQIFKEYKERKHLEIDRSIFSNHSTKICSCDKQLHLMNYWKQRIICYKKHLAFISIWRKTLMFFLLLVILDSTSAKHIKALLPLGSRALDGGTPIGDCGIHSSCSLCMAQPTCAWISGACNGYLMRKTISQYAQCKSSTQMKKYCLNYVDDSYQNVLSGVTLSTQAVDGIIPSATYCQWNFQLKGGVNTKLLITRKLNGFDMIQLQVEGTNGEIATLSDSSISSAQMEVYVSSNLNFASDKLTVQTVYLQDCYSSQDSIIITEDSKSSDNTIIGIIVLLLISCTSVVICTCCFVIIRAIFKGRAYRNFVRYQREFQVERQRNNENRLELLLIEIPSVSYNPGVIQFSQTNCIICLENFIIGGKVRIMPECKHVFHTSCVDTWLKSKLNEELRCAHCSIILKTSEEIAKLEQVKAEEKKNDHALPEINEANSMNANRAAIGQPEGVNNDIFNEIDQLIGGENEGSKIEENHQSMLASQHKNVKKDCSTRIQALPPMDIAYEDDDTNKLLADFGNIDGIRSSISNLKPKKSQANSYALSNHYVVTANKINHEEVDENFIDKPPAKINQKWMNSKEEEKYDKSIDQSYNELIQEFD